MSGQQYGSSKLNQEDSLQAVGRPRDQKYRFQGGPTLIDLLRFTRESAPEDTDTLLRVVAFNVQIGNTDAPAKNYSVLITPDGHRRAAAGAGTGR